jgi:hypothetical protein
MKTLIVAVVSFAAGFTTGVLWLLYDAASYGSPQTTW